MDSLTLRLLNDYQRDFPLNPRPFAVIARSLNTDTETVLQRLQQLRSGGTISRVGAVFRPNTVGVSTLAAMAVPPRLVERVASMVSDFSQVNHNYEREHRYNLWFVVTAGDQTELDLTLRRIEQTTGYSVLSLPLVRDYHIDLGFRMNPDAQSQVAPLRPDDRCGTMSCADPPHAADLIEAIQDGLPLIERPYRRIGEQVGCSECAVIAHLSDMTRQGIIRRVGVVVRHQELGFGANAMVVWNVPDTEVESLGRRLGAYERVTLCYQRPRRLPQWPYNLFSMIHGRKREEVLACIERMSEDLRLKHVDRQVLFSTRRFKQRGAWYRGMK